MTRFVGGLLIVAVLILLWAVALNVGTIVSGGLQEWLQL